MIQQATDKEPAPELPPLSDWRVEALRFSAFFRGNMVGVPADWWMNVVDEPPDTKTEEPRGGTHRQELGRDDRKIVLHVQPGRIDWLFGPYPIEAYVQRGAIPEIGAFPEILTDFHRLVGRWLQGEEYPSLSRIAFGSVLLYPVEDRRLGYRLINRYLPSVELDWENSIDFMYQINRPRRSTTGIEGLFINRLTKWAVFQATAEALLQNDVRQLYRFSACRLETDINTDADYDGSFDREQGSLIFDELTELSQEIVSEGDQP